MKTPTLFTKHIRRGNNRGIAVIYIALLIVPLVAFAGLAIDIGYMYVAKSQLQNAADAAALAGAAVLSEGSKSTNQPVARNEAWKIACNNKMVPSGSPVFLVSNSANCSSPPTDLNNTNNDPDGDIILGHWDPITGFTPGDNIAYVNAVKVVARRTSDTPVSNVKIGSNPVSIFFGKIFQLISGGGTGWPTLNASAQAIAVRSNPPMVNLTLCTSSCGYVTPIETIAPNITPGTRFYLKGSALPLIGWTTFFDNDTSAKNIDDYLTGNKPPPDLCNLPYPSCLYTTNGVDNPVICTLKGLVNDRSKDYIVNGVTIHGYKVFIPIVSANTANPCNHKGPACLDDPTYQPGDAFPFESYAEAIITDAVPQGNCPKVTGQLAGGDPGIVIVGTKSAGTGFSSIECFNCEASKGRFINSTKLVK